MTDEELTMWQYLDESRDRIEALEADNKELRATLVVLINLLNDKMEITNGVQTTQNGGATAEPTRLNNRRWFKSCR